MELQSFKIKGLKKIINPIHYDNCGFFREIYKNKLFNRNFFFDVMPYSKKNVCKGLHIQVNKPQAKIITVTQGKNLEFFKNHR
tara:strand:+ start:3429 stop:3677 length:249 start_codon:yes stop_codon:yes gene_type:complete